MTRTPLPQRRVWPPETYETITLQNIGDEVVVLTAPELALISLDLLPRAEITRMEVHRDMIRLAGTVDYQVIGWDLNLRALIVRRVADRRFDQSTETDKQACPEGNPPGA